MKTFCFLGRLGTVLLSILALGLSLTQVLAGPLEPAAPRCDRYVFAATGIDSGACTSASQPCRTVQYALRQAVQDDRLCIAGSSPRNPTTYTGTIVLNKSVTLDGAWEASCSGGLGCSFTAVPCSPQGVVLNAQGAGRVFSITGKIRPTIYCFTITGGDAAGLGGDPGSSKENDAGGGIYSHDAAPLIIQNIITGNYGCRNCPQSYGRGGGIYLYNAPATAVISGNTIVANVADDSTWGQGGGILLRNSRGQIRNNEIYRNRAGHSAGYGGGVAAVNSYPVIADNQIISNVAGLAVQGLGGGIFLWINEAPAARETITVERNRLQENWAVQGTADPGLVGAGGGIDYRGDENVTLLMHNNAVRKNIAAMGGLGQGGGMFLQDLSPESVVNDNGIEENIAGLNDKGHGGGIYLEESRGAVIDNHVRRNTASPNGDEGMGGGFYGVGGGGWLQSNEIAENIALENTTGGYGWGGGMVLSNSLATVQDNQIIRNSAVATPGALGVGGGLFILYGAPDLVRNQILSNTTGNGTLGFGGGLFSEESAVTIDGNMVVGNSATGSNYGHGGGIRIALTPHFTLTNNIVVRNQAGPVDPGSIGPGVMTRNQAGSIGPGIAVQAGAGEIAHNTVVDNQGAEGAGIRIDSNTIVTLTNNLIVSQTSGIYNATPVSSTVLARYTLFQNNGTDYSAGVTNQNPVAGPADLQSDYHLGKQSGARDHGLLLPWVTLDVDGDSRPFGSAPDVGADEYRIWVYLPLSLRNS